MRAAGLVYFRAWFRAGVVACVLAGACNRAPARDLSSPEATVASFFHALGQGRFPAELDRFIAGNSELRLWQARCRVRGCTGGSYRILSQKLLAHRAELRVRYRIQGRRGVTVASTQDTVVQLVRDQDRWLIARIGERIPVAAPAAGNAAGAAAPDQVGPDQAAARNAAAEQMR